MSSWGPVAAPVSTAEPWVTDGVIASVVLPEDLLFEFGASYSIDQPSLDAATQKVEEMLHRPLRNAVYQERSRILYDPYVDPLFGMAGYVLPRAIPVQAVLVPTGTVIVDNGVEIRYVPPDDIMLGFFGFSGVEMYGTITYQGGYAPADLPSELRTIILKVAIRMAMRKTPGSMLDVAVPGMNNPRLDDMGFSTGPEYGSLFDAADRKELRRWTYRGSF